MLLRRPAVAFGLAAILLLAPSLMLGTMPSHSSPQNITWAAQFADQFRAGILYPRTLPQSFDHLGAPIFYFYPPIGFWVDALLSVVTFNAISVSWRLSLSWLLLLWASGLAMHAWLKEGGLSPRAALFGALGYMAAPYHLLDHYYRGAYAEFAAYAVLPLVTLAIRRIAERRRFAVVLLALSYAALPMAHLPTSLLISLTALPLYALYRGWRLGDRRAALAFLARCALGTTLGLGLAAIYLVPALSLQDWISSDRFWSGDYHVDNWFLLTPQRWPRGGAEMAWIIASSAGGYALAAVGVLLMAERRSEAAFWAAVSLVCLVLIAGVVPWFWQLPFVAKVQFPWRLLIVVEFAGITALAQAPWPAPSRLSRVVFAAALAALIPGLASMAEGIFGRVQLARAGVAARPADVKEFLPAGYPQKPNAGYAELGLGPVLNLPAITCTPQARLCRASDGAFGAMRVEVAADQPTTVVLRRFYYPLWRLESPQAIAPTEPLKLVAFEAAPGAHLYRLAPDAVPAEKIGWLISGLSLVLLAVLAALSSNPTSRSSTPTSADRARTRQTTSSGSRPWAGR
jgi:hypothetical protein